MSLKCFLFGHIGEDSESGFHVCSRCGDHEYWDSTKVRDEHQMRLGRPYERSAMLFRPFLSAKFIIINRFHIILHWWRYDARNEAPF